MQTLKLNILQKIGEFDGPSKFLILPHNTYLEIQQRPLFHTSEQDLLGYHLQWCVDALMHEKTGVVYSNRYCLALQLHAMAPIRLAKISLVRQHFLG